MNQYVCETCQGSGRLQCVDCEAADATVEGEDGERRCAACNEREERLQAEQRRSRLNVA
jgi:hypothetical protein